MKILVFGGFGKSLLNFRGPLLQALASAGHTVLGVAPDDSPELRERLCRLGAHFVPLSLERTGLNPFADFQTFVKLCVILQREQPDVLLAYTIKPIIYGTIAASIAGVPRVYALNTGLGSAFYTPGFRGRVLMTVVSALYRMAFFLCRRVIVQNQDIAEFFVRQHIVSDPAQLAIVAGSGVDLSFFAAVPLPLGSPTFLLLGRMLQDKGIVEYVEAARRVRKIMPSARFLLVGDTDSNPASLREEWLQALHAEGVVEYHPAVNDVRPFLAASTCYVLPSYHEGLPRTVLEAMSIGRPIITTDVIGCRETIFDLRLPDANGIRRGRNGLLVPVKDPAALAAAMTLIAGDGDMAKAMGTESRQLAGTYFDVSRVNDRMLEIMDIPREQPVRGTRVY